MSHTILTMKKSLWADRMKWFKFAKWDSLRIFLLLQLCILFYFTPFYFYPIFLHTEPCRDPDLCKHFAANQPDTSPCSQCVSGYLWGEITNVVSVCVLQSLGEKMVFACVSALAMCLGMMRLLGSLSNSLPMPAFVCVFYTSVCACTNSPDSEIFIGQASSLRVSWHIIKHNGVNTGKSCCAH